MPAKYKTLDKSSSGVEVVVESPIVRVDSFVERCRIRVDYLSDEAMRELYQKLLLVAERDVQPMKQRFEAEDVLDLAALGLADGSELIILLNATQAAVEAWDETEALRLAVVSRANELLGQADELRDGDGIPTDVIRFDEIVSLVNDGIKVLNEVVDLACNNLLQLFLVSAKFVSKREEVSFVFDGGVFEGQLQVNFLKSVNPQLLGIALNERRVRAETLTLSAGATFRGERTAQLEKRLKRRRQKRK